MDAVVAARELGLRRWSTTKNPTQRVTLVPAGLERMFTMAKRFNNYLAANWQQVRKTARFGCPESARAELATRTPVLFLRSNLAGGGAWESNPPSTRKLAEQPF